MSIERKSDRWISVTQSVLLHGLVVGALAYGFYAYKRKPTPPQPTLAVEASVVEQKSAAPPPKAPAPPPPQPTPEPPPEDVGPPAPTPEEIQKREEAQKEEQQKQQQKRDDQERVALERKQADEKAAAEQKARDEDAERKRKADAKAAEEKRVADAKRKVEEQRKAEIAREQTERDAELRKTLEAEERADQVRSSGVVNTWLAQIQAKVKRAWIRPQSARAGLECVVRVTQTTGGEVTAVSVGDCNGDAAVRASIEDAVYRASPLPPAPDPAVFDRNIVFRFKPTD